jgi:hypothetical protein
VVEVIAVCVLLKGYDPWMLARFLGPSIFAIGLFAVLVLLAHDSATNPLLSTELKWWEQLGIEVRRPFDYLANRLFLIVGVVLSFAVCMGHQISVQELTSEQTTKPLLTTQFRTTYDTFTASFSNGVGTLFTSNNRVDPLVQGGGMFRQINSAIPEDSKVLSAVEFPELLDMNKFRVSTLDFPGANSPAPGIGLSGPPKGLMEYLEKLGYGYIVAQSSGNQSSMYANTSARELEKSPWFNYRSTGSAIIKWDNLLVATLNNGYYKADFFGTYVVISTKKNAVKEITPSYLNEVKIFTNG